jgi:hypothetical protein
VRAGPNVAGRRPAGGAVGGTVLSAFAVGCPICNKVVVVALGAGGAVSYFSPVQPLIGLASIALLGTALALRLRAALSCSVGAGSHVPSHTRESGEFRYPSRADREGDLARRRGGAL